MAQESSSGVGAEDNTVKKETMTEYCSKLESWLWQVSKFQDI